MTTSRTIKVCHLAPADVWGGAEAQLVVLLSVLSKVPDLEVSAVLLNEDRVAHELARMGINTLVIPEASHSFISLSVRLIRHFAHHPIDVLHTHKWKDNALGAVATAAGSVRRLVRTVHGCVEPLGGFKAAKMNAHYALDNLVNRLAVDRILTVSRELTADFVGRFGAEKVTCIHNGIDLERIRVTGRLTDLRNELGLSREDVVVGTMGRLVPIKGLDLFLNAARQIRDRRQDVKFVIAGDGPLRDSLRTMARQLDLEDDVLFLGHRDDNCNTLALMDVFVLPSLSEGVPMVLLEALALSRPVVASRVGGIPEVIEHDVSGILIDTGQPDELVRGCLALIEDRGRAERLGVAGRKRIEQRFSADAMAASVTAVYRALVRNDAARNDCVRRVGLRPIPGASTAEHRGEVGARPWRT